MREDSGLQDRRRGQGSTPEIHEQPPMPVTEACLRGFIYCDLRSLPSVCFDAGWTRERKGRGCGRMRVGGAGCGCDLSEPSGCQRPVTSDRDPLADHCRSDQGHQDSDTSTHRHIRRVEWGQKQIRDQGSGGKLSCANCSFLLLFYGDDFET